MAVFIYRQSSVLFNRRISLLYRCRYIYSRPRYLSVHLVSSACDGFRARMRGFDNPQQRNGERKTATEVRAARLVRFPIRVGTAPEVSSNGGGKGEKCVLSLCRKNSLAANVLVVRYRVHVMRILRPRLPIHERLGASSACIPVTSLANVLADF